MCFKLVLISIVIKTKQELTVHPSIVGLKQLLMNDWDEKRWATAVFAATHPNPKSSPLGYNLPLAGDIIAFLLSNHELCVRIVVIAAANWAVQLRNGGMGPELSKGFCFEEGVQEATRFKGSPSEIIWRNSQGNSPFRLFCPSRSCRCSVGSPFLWFECGCQRFLSPPPEELKKHKRKKRTR